MNASSESGLWATWMVVIGSFRGGARRGERGVDVVLVQEVLGQRGGPLSGFRGEEPGVEGTGARFVLLEARDARRQDEPEQMRGTLREDRVRLGAREGEIAAHLAEPAEVVALVEVERLDHLVGGARHREE